MARMTKAEIKAHTDWARDRDLEQAKSDWLETKSPGGKYYGLKTILNKNGVLIRPTDRRHPGNPNNPNYKNPNYVGPPMATVITGSGLSPEEKKAWVKANTPKGKKLTGRLREGPFYK